MFFFCFNIGGLHSIRYPSNDENKLHLHTVRLTKKGKNTSSNSIVTIYSANEIWFKAEWVKKKMRKMLFLCLNIERVFFSLSVRVLLKIEMELTLCVHFFWQLRNFLRRPSTWFSCFLFICFCFSFSNVQTKQRKKKH